jgi:hypothetical protein
MVKNSLILFLILAAGLSACAPTSQNTVVPTEIVVLPTETATPAATETVKPTVEQTLAPTEVVVILPLDGDLRTCVDLSAHEPLPDVAYEEYPAAIMEYLNQGASPEELAVELIVRDLNPNEQPVWAEDLTGDGVRDVVVSIYNLQIQPQGGMMIYTCVEGQYQLDYISLASQTEHAPEALVIQDLNADQLPDLVFTMTNCGAHTCFDDVEILSWIDGRFTELVEGSTTDLPNPSAQLTDYNRDGIYSLEVVGTAVASVGAGPQRDRTKIWEYDQADGLWKFASESLASSPFRIHLVHDADDAMLRGEYQIASLLFAQVVSEGDDLLDWLNPTEEESNLSAYAYYKQVVAAGFLAQIQQGADLLTEMEEEYGGTGQVAYLQMAQAFWQAFTGSGSAEEGCNAAHQYAVLNQLAVLTPLSSETYGYANRDYGPTDICP